MVLSFPCCTHYADSRLVRADSLMNTHPDSAYAILKSIKPASLQDKEGKAYYALLYTQAQYKNYDSIRSDSLINIAVNYFSDNHDREKYTRSLLYKGAAFSDMGNKLDAMYYYKCAEANADSKDYELKGQINIRMAELYREMEVEDNMDMEKFKEALRYYEKAGDKKFQIVCLNSIGSIYRGFQIDSAYKYLFHALQLSREIGDSSNIFINISSISRAYWADSLFSKSKDLAVFAIKNGSKYLPDQNCYYDACTSYAELGKADSALFYFKQIKAENSVEDLISRELALMEIEKAKKNYKSSLDHLLKFVNAYNLISHNPVRNQLLISEKQYDKQKNELSQIKLQKEKLILFFCAFLFIIVLLAWILKYRQRQKDYINLIGLMQSEANESKEYLSIQLEKDSQLKVAVEQLIENVKYLTNASYQYSDVPAAFMECFWKRVKLTRFQDNMLNNLKLILDTNYNNIITRLSAEYPILSNDELDFISLICYGFSFAAITVCMGYSNPNYVNNKKIRIAKKMQLKQPLRQYLNNLMEESISNNRL